MMFKTHLMFSLLISLLIFDYFRLNSVLFILILVLSGSLPDIDHAKSKIGRKLFLISWLVNLFFGHRKLIHSVWIAALLSFLIKLSFGDYWAPFFIGYLSHLFSDSLTKQGIQFFYPIKSKISGFVKTNGFIEKIFLFVLIILNAYYAINYIF